jgi:hypothetical protein
MAEVADVVKSVGMFACHVLQVPQPVLGQARAALLDHRLHPTAAVVPDHEHMLDFQDLDGVLQRGQAIEVGVHHQVADVAVHEDLARSQSQDLVGRNAAVGATNPQVPRRLLLGKPPEVAWILRHAAGRPGAIVLEQGLDAAHAEAFGRWLGG